MSTTTWVVLAALAATACALVIVALLRHVRHERSFREGLKELKRLKTDTDAAIQSKFDEWWQNDPRRSVIEHLRYELGPYKTFCRSDRELEELMLPRVKELKEDARLVAVQARLNPLVRELISRQPTHGHIQQRLAQEFNTTDWNPVTVRLELLRYGVDPGRLERYFASAA